jgi:hypothetical protein
MLRGVQRQMQHFEILDALHRLPADEQERVLTKHPIRLVRNYIWDGREFKFLGVGVA